jgi:putative tricarboxylic transport membrane protein
MYSQGDFIPFLTQPIAAVFLILAVLSIVFKLRDTYKKKKLDEAGGINTGI